MAFLKTGEVSEAPINDENSPKPMEPVAIGGSADSASASIPRKVHKPLQLLRRGSDPHEKWYSTTCSDVTSPTLLSFVSFSSIPSAPSIFSFDSFPSFPSSVVTWYTLGLAPPTTVTSRRSSSSRKLCLSISACAAPCRSFSSRARACLSLMRRTSSSRMASDSSEDGFGKVGITAAGFPPPSPSFSLPPILPLPSSLSLLPPSCSSSSTRPWRGFGLSSSINSL